MVGWLHEGEERSFLPRPRPRRIADLLLLEVALPPKVGSRQRASGPKREGNRAKQGASGQKQGRNRSKPGEEREKQLAKEAKQGARGAKILKKQGVIRALMPPNWEEGAQKQGLFPVKPLPLYRALGGRLCLRLLEPVPPRRRRVVLRGEGVDPAARALARALCPRCALVLDLGREGEDLARQLQRDYGAPPLGPAWAEGAQVVVELGPAPGDLPTGAHRLKLWGEPDLAGLALEAPPDLPPDLPRDPFLALLWESGRLELGQIGLLGP